jgi:hypothetical protein
MGGQVHSVEDAKEGNVRFVEETLLSRWGVLKLCGGGLAGLVAGLMLLGVAGCGNGDDQQENQQGAGQQDGQQNTNQQDAVRDVDRCPQRC